MNNIIILVGNVPMTLTEYKIAYENVTKLFSICPN